MYTSTAFALLSVLFFSMPALSMPVDDSTPQKRATVYHGRGTYFEVGLGACGFNNVDSDFIVALPESQYSEEHCNKHVKITNTQNGKTAIAQVRDKCPGCEWGHLDMSPGLYQNGLGAQEAEGVIPITWSFLNY